MLKQTPRGPLGSAHAGGLSKLRHLVANTCCAQRSPTIRNRGQPAGAIEIYFIKRPYLNQRGNSIVSREIVIYSFSIEQVFFHSRPVITNCLQISGRRPLQMALLWGKLFRVIKWHFFTNLNFLSDAPVSVFQLFSIFTVR